MNKSGGISRGDQIWALINAVRYRPLLSVAIIVGGVITALFEGIGLGFIVPIVEIIQSSGDPAAEADGILLAFVSVYRILGVPFELSFVILGVSLILTVRWTMTFVVRWFRSALMIDYTREIQRRSFAASLDARVEYFDREGSDDILNAIVTQAEYAGRVIQYFVQFIEQGLLTLMYLMVAFILSPLLTLFAIVFLGGFSILFRYILEPGYDLGDEVADANERVQQAAQAGTQGIRDTKLFGLKKELFSDIQDALNKFATSAITLRRNQQAIRNFYNLLTAISVFVMIFLAIEFADMSLASLGVFLFAMFRLGPKASDLNSAFYRIENNLPHLVRMQQFVAELEQNSEQDKQMECVPSVIQTVEFDDVHFTYGTQEQPALKDISFKFEAGEFIAFVGHSGAGKSTIVSLLARMYEPDAGTIYANNRPIHQMPIDEWRSKVAVVRQDPFIFNNTLRYNLTIGNRDVSQEKLDQICRIAKINEFIDQLPRGYETKLGDNGVRLSGGQRQRVAIARALLKPADLLILDEATSELDSNLEKQVQEAIERTHKKYAMVVIAHRLSTVKNADRIYAMDSGEIMEIGSHEDLLENGEQYAELYATQTQNG